MNIPVRRTIELLFLSVALLSGGSSAAWAESAYYQIAIGDLKITEGELPTNENRVNPRLWTMGRSMLPYAVLDGEGEIYLGDQVGRRSFVPRRRNRNRVLPPPANAAERNEREQQWRVSANAVAVRAPAGKDVTGTLYAQKNDLSGLAKVRFRIPADRAGGDDARRNFLLTKEAHYQELIDRQFPGGAWFRYQAQLARSELTGKTLEEPVTTTDPTRPQRPTRNDYEDTFQVFSGGRAISENLQLDRLIQGTKPEEETVEISTIKGITVKEMDWEALTKDINPELDPLARVIPADQHAVFMPSFDAMVTLMDEAKDKGTPILHLVQRRAESAQSKERYEKQLCLEIDALSRLLGPQVISSVAFTGSDPYLRTGTDVAVIFEAKSKSVLANFLATKHATAAAAHADAQQVKGQVAQTNYSGVVTPDRRICSYTASLGNAVVVTNSLAQLERLARTHEGQEEALGTLAEYQFFRERYPRGDSTGLLVVTDQTIRRWCSPKWRIATSRRTRAAAILAHHQAVNLTELVNDSANPQTIHTQLHVADLGTLKLTEEGVTSSTYGSLDFQTPIIELDLARVTPTERDAYNRWRNGYESYWRQFFDPIAVSFSVEPGRIGADVTVMPLIDGSDYNDFIRLSSGASIKPDAGDRHAGTLAHWAMAINVASQPVQRTGNFARAMMPGLNDGPFSWLGESISIYADPDPFWLDLAKAEDPDRFFREEFHRLPEKYRSVLFLCCVEGLSREDTAEQLGLSPGSVKGRLERGRHLLRQRLMLRGASFSLAMALLSGLQQPAQAAQVVAPSLIASTVQGGLTYAGGNGTAGLVSQNALSLANGSFQIMSMTTAKMAAGCLLMIGTLAALSWVPAPATAGGSGSGEDLDSTRLVAPAGGETLLAFAFPGEGEGRRGGGEREGGARRSPEAEAGPRRSAEGDAGPRRSAEGDAGPRRGAEGGNRDANPLQGFRPQTPREAALLQMILQLQREMADLRRAVGQPAGSRRDGAARDGGARDGGPRDGGPRDGEGRRGGIPDGTVSAAPAGWERTKAGSVFRAYDKNGDQFVSLEEFLAMTNGNISATRRALQTKRFQETRPGADGKLSPAEFIGWYNNRNGAAPRDRGEGGRAAEGEGRRSPEAEAGPRRSPEADAGPRRSAERDN